MKIAIKETPFRRDATMSLRVRHCLRRVRGSRLGRFKFLFRFFFKNENLLVFYYFFLHLRFNVQYFCMVIICWLIVWGEIRRNRKIYLLFRQDRFGDKDFGHEHHCTSTTKTAMRRMHSNSFICPVYNLCH